MIAVSSFAPFARSSAIAKNQLAAKISWEKIFSKIIYVCQQPEPKLASDKTVFVKCDAAFPGIMDLVSQCARQIGWSCIINADIQVTGQFRRVESELMRRRAQSAMSLRWQLPENKVMDNGLDFFAAEQPLWECVLKHIPDWFKIGHCLWDTWLLAFFTQAGTWGCPGPCMEITGSRCIYHPKHEDRFQPHQSEMKIPKDGVIDKLVWPHLRIN